MAATRTLSRLVPAAALCVLWAACAPDSAPREAAAEETMSLASADARSVTVKVYKSPTCGCCANWVDHMRAAGFRIEVHDTEQMAAVKADAGVPIQLQSCHTAVVGDYVFEGHIPPDAIARFLDEKPAAKGLAVPGMPIGSPGMEMDGRKDPYDVILIGRDGTTSVYESR